MTAVSDGTVNASFREILCNLETDLLDKSCFYNYCI